MRENVRFNKKTDVNSQDFTTNKVVEFKQTYKDIHETDIVKTVSQIDVYNSEKDESSKYRFIFTIDGLFTNVLTNITGENSLSTFNEMKFKAMLDPLSEGGITQRQDITFAESIVNHLIAEEGWVGYYDMKGLSKDCNLIPLKPSREYFDFYSGVGNWDIKIFYIYDKIELDGLQIVKHKTIDYGGREMTLFYSPIKHNLNIGDVVQLELGEFKGEYVVYDIGDEVGENRENVFVIEMDSSINEMTPENELIFKFWRISNGNKVHYYKRMLRALDNTQYLITEPGFATNTFKDKLTQIVYQEPVDLGGVKDYMGRDLTEVYVGFLKRPYDMNGSEFFTRLMSGYKLNYYNHEYQPYINIQTINQIDNDETLDSDILLNTDNLTLDLCEFDSWKHVETTLEEVFYRFNTIDRETDEPKIVNDFNRIYDMGVRKEGYMYKPFNKIPLLSMSDVYYGDEFSTLPIYANEYEEGLFNWCEIIPKSLNQNIKYPFLNGVHYVEKLIQLQLKRQDPFGKWGLFYSNFPSDRPGRKNKLLKNAVIPNIPNDEC